MTPNEIISGLLAIARKSQVVVARMRDGHPLKAEHVGDIETAINDLADLPGEGDPITRATAALQSFIESTGGNVAVPREVFAAAGRRVDPPQDRYAPNTIYSVATDSTGKPVIYGSRSTSAPHEDTHIMESALEFEQAKRLRNVEVQPHKVGNLWMTTVEPIEISHDFYSHRHTWRAAIQRCIDSAPPATADSDDASYWQHELKAFDRTFDTLPQEHSRGLKLFIPETVRNRLFADTANDAQRIIGDADLLQSLRNVCGFIEAGEGEPVTICQDDATGDWSLTVGREGKFANLRRYNARSFHQVIAMAAREEMRDEPELEKCAFCGLSFESPCETIPTGPCEQANNAFHGSDPTKPLVQK